MNDKMLYNRLPARYKKYGDMPTMVEIQEAIVYFMSTGSDNEIDNWEKNIKY